MQLTHKELSDIYKKSLSLKELAAFGVTYSFDEEREDAQIFHERVEKWRQIIAQGNDEDFAKRFLWSGIDFSLLNGALNNRIDERELSLPEWTQTVNSCLGMMDRPQQHTDLISKAIFDSTFPRPFEEILIYFVQYARENLKERTGDAYCLFSDEAHAKFERGLLVYLSRLNGLTMELEFSAFRASCQSGLKRAFKSSGGNKSVYYSEFVKSLLNGEIINYFKEYAVLAKLISSGIDLWIEFISEVICRVKKDNHDIEQTFNEGKFVGRVVDVTTTISDRHNKGRSVLSILFESGLRLIYKPKNLGIEVAYNSLIQWLNKNEAPVQLRTYKVLNCINYGWAEFISRRESEDKMEELNYYRKSGSLLCIAYILGATDLHFENIIKDGEDPVLVDLETLLHPFAKDLDNSAEGETAETLAKNKIIDSVIRTGLLPRWNIQDNGQAYDVSGLGEFMPQEYVAESAAWEGMNTDVMRVKKSSANIYSEDKNVDASFRFNLSLDEIINESIKGFNQTYNFFIDNRDKIMASSSWNSLNSQAGRFVFRPTGIYLTVQLNLLHPKLLRNGIDRSIHLDILFGGMTGKDTSPVWWPLIEYEQAEMEMMDIPYFSVSTDSDSLILTEGQQIRGYFQNSGFANATLRLKQLCKKDLNEQEQFIKSSFLCRTAKVNHSVSQEIRGKELQSVEDCLLSQEMAIKKATAIACVLKEKAIMGKDGSVTWIAPKYHLKTGRYQLETMSNDLYEGTIGVSMFFAALFALTGEREFKTISLGCLNNTLKQNISANLTAGALGGYVGYGSVIYGLLHVGILTCEPRLVKAARNVAVLCNRDIIESGRSYDIMHGTAGMILSLLELHSYCNDEVILSLLRYCGDHLLAHRSMTNSGFRAWQSKSGICLTGYSHGTAGIACSLLRLYKLTGIDAYKKAALEGIAYENCLFDGVERNWPDLRISIPKGTQMPAKVNFCSNWCNGASGIGLARLSAFDVVGTDDIIKDIFASVDLSKRSLNEDSDYVCCGNFGRLGLLQAAALQFGDQKLLEFTLKKAGELIVTSEQNGGFRYSPFIGFTPGFFQGITGIGYQILRMTFPQSLPDILTLN